MLEEKKIVLNADEKEVVERRSKDLFFAVKKLNDWVQSDSLTEEMRETLPTLVNRHLDDIKACVGFTGEEPDHLKQMTKSLNKAREEQIAELEKIVESKNSILTVKQQLKEITDKINNWWDVKGFNYIKDITFLENGIIVVNFGFMLNSLSLRFSDTPNSDKKAAEEKFQRFIDNGYIFAKSESSCDRDLIDCKVNRNLLSALIKSSFPSAKITKWENHIYLNKGPDQDSFYLRSFKVYIYNYEDIVNL
ncbi:hypothetical protein [Virgibacillus halodenitrificans]|uniref:hypothetical protein n=1 Tax=Virgibacillus halodenitrificans TaxID=1482 RepID=UPI000EF4D471|nr:hypothetical protein [Virgibacillus halodenitrificans]